MSFTNFIAMFAYFSIARCAAIAVPILFSMLAFFGVRFGNSWPSRLGPAVFHVRVVSGVLFIMMSMALPGSPGKLIHYVTPGFPTENYSLLLTVLLSIAANRLARKAAENESVRKIYPQLRVSEWSWQLIAGNSFTWLFYLFGYELFFRGFLLFSALEYMSMPIAIALNVICYALAHALKGWRECLSSIPFGFLLCILTVSSGNIWSAFAIHATLALSNDWFALKMPSWKNIDNSYPH